MSVANNSSVSYQFINIQIDRFINIQNPQKITAQRPCTLQPF